MIQRSLVAFWLCASSLIHDCCGQTVQEILERTSRAMEPPIRFRLSANGKSCTVLQKRLDDESIAIRMEFATPASLIRIETNSASFEVYPKAKLVIDVGFMGANSRAQLAEVLGLMGRSLPITGEELHLATETEFEGKPCWKVTQANPDHSSSSTLARVNQTGSPQETAAYIDKQTYKIAGLETYSKAGEKLVQTIISNIEKPSELSSNLFLPPADFAVHKPLSIVEYLSMRESLVAAQVLTRMTDDNKARQLQAQNMLATAKARAAVAQRLSARLTYYLPILIACMIAFVIANAIWSQRRVADRWKQMANDPAASQAQLAKIMDAAKMSSWTRFTKAPLVLKAFVIYAVCATVVGLSLPFFLPIRTYSSFLGFQLLVPLFLIHAALSRLEMRRGVYAVAALLAFYGALGIFRFLTFQPLGLTLPSSSRYGAPYFVLEGVLPIVWAFLLISPSMQKWLRAKSSDEVQVHQISMADLLFFMLVASLALTASMALIRTIN